MLHLRIPKSTAVHVCPYNILHREYAISIAHAYRLRYCNCAIHACCCTTLYGIVHTYRMIKWRITRTFLYKLELDGSTYIYLSGKLYLCIVKASICQWHTSREIDTYVIRKLTRICTFRLWRLHLLKFVLLILPCIFNACVWVYVLSTSDSWVVWDWATSTTPCPDSLLFATPEGTPYQRQT